MSKSPFLALTIAAAFLIIAIDCISLGLTKKLPILKYLFDLSVDAPQYLSPGTLIFPMLSIQFCISYMNQLYNTPKIYLLNNNKVLETK